MSVYNDEEYLREAIESILGQTFKDFEFLIIDDGSTDSSADIIRSYSDPRISFIQNERNIGLTRSLNKGLKLARGKYIARQDADDISLPERLEKQVRFLDEHRRVGLLSGSHTDINTNGEEIRFCKPPTDNDVIKQQLFRLSCFCHTSSMFRKKCIERVGPYREECGCSEDYDLWLRIAEEFDVANIEQLLCKVRIVAGSISASREARRGYYHHLASTLAIQRHLFGEDKFGYRPPGERFVLLRQELSKGFIARRRIMSNKYLIWSQKYPFKGYGRRDRKTAIKYLLKSLINNPLNLRAWCYIPYRIAGKTKNAFESLLSKLQRSSSPVVRRMR
jgi:glycosyltransferase involved in cell wall biosynthesis